LTRPRALCETPAYMRYRGRMEFAHERKIRERNTSRYRLAHWPIWIFVFFLFPGPLTFSLFAHGFSLFNGIWLVAVLIGTGIACYKAQLPGSEHRPYILRFDEDKPNPLYRRVCYTFAWNAILNFALMNLIGLVVAVINGRWYMKPIYQYAYLPVCALILTLGALGLLPRVMKSTKGEGTERRYFYGGVWSVTAAQTILLVLWKTLPQNETTSWIKLAVYLGVLTFMGYLTYHGRLPRTRPIVAGELIID
jgi:L-asparagine transporter-like permease